MPSKTKINNSTYSITGGKTCINGTSYQIAKGKSYINGSNYNIGFYKYYWWKYEAVRFTNGYNGDNNAYTYSGSDTETRQVYSELITLQYTTVYTQGSSYYGYVAVTGMGEPVKAEDYPVGTIKSAPHCDYQSSTRFYLFNGTYEVKYNSKRERYEWHSIGTVSWSEYSKVYYYSAFVKGALIEIVGSNNQNEYSEGVDSSRNYIYIRKYY